MSIFKRIGIPGPEPNLITGNMSTFFNDFNEVNVEFHSWLLNTYGPVVGYYLGSKPIILVKHIGLLKEIQHLKDFEERPRLVPGGINPSPKRAKMLGNLPVNQWRNLRRILNKSFTISKMKQIIPLINEAIIILIEKLEQNQNLEINFYEFYQKLTLDIIGRTAFGVDTQVQTNQNDRLLLSVKESFEKSPNRWLIRFCLCFPEIFLIIQMIRKSIECIKEYFGLSLTSQLWDDCAKTLSDRKTISGKNRKDLLQCMIESGLPEDIIIAQSMLFFEASYETLSASLAFITHILLNNEEVAERMADELNEYLVFDYQTVSELNFMDSIIAEALRLFPPQTTFISRANSKSDYKYIDSESGIQYVIPKGIQIQVALYQIHRDPDNYDSPQQFDSQRFLHSNPFRSHGENGIKWQPFGTGRRHCIGQTYARVVLKLILSNIISKFKLIKTPNTAALNGLDIKFKTATMTPSTGVFGSVILRK